MSFFSKLSAAPLVLAGASLLVATACETYEPPPEPHLVRSGGGAYTVGDALTLEFSEAIEPDSLDITLWPSDRGTRRVASEDVEPYEGPCNAVDNGCEQIELELDDDFKSLSITVDEPLGGMGSHFVMEITDGLQDQEGNATGVSRYFNVRFRGPTDPDPNANIDVQDGTYIFGGAVNEPMRAVLTLVSDVKVLPDGRLVVAGAEGDVTDDDASDTSRDPDIIEVDTTDRGWALFFRGLVVENDEGRRFMETEVFDVVVPVLGHLTLYMEEVRLFAEITTDEDGHDYFDGTLTYERLLLGDEEFDGDSTPLIGEYVPEEQAIEGTPTICDNPCGDVIGQCEIPEDFPHPDFCADDDADGTDGE